MDKMKMETANKTLENLAKLKEMFPEVITETKDANGDIVSAVDAKKLEQLLSTKVIEGDESYDFTWVGKKQAMVEANRPIRKTLRPCKEESVDWEKTENLYIEGDNLDVLKLLQESYLNKIKMIYIDPPYNTGNDSFIYPDDYKTNKDQYDEEVGAIDESGYRMFKNTETNGRFHSSWCSMMYPRLKLARNLLSEDGVIFISIDDNEVDNMRKMCDEIYGSENFISKVVRIAKTTSFRGNHFAPSKDYILVYAKSISAVVQFCDDVDNTSQFKKIETTGSRAGEYYRDDIAFYLSTLETRPNQRYYIKCPDGELVVPPGKTMPISNEDGSKAVPVEGDGVWRWEVSQYMNKKDLLVFKETSRSPLLNQYGKQAKWNIYTKSYLKDKQEKGNIPRDVFEGYLNRNGSEELSLLNVPFSFPKPSKLVKYLAKISQSDGVVLDFFSGSATTAHAVMQLNAEDGGKRKFIMVQLPEVCDEKSEAYKAGYKNICEIGKERIRRAGKKIVEETGKKDLDIGFRVLKLDESNMKDVYFTPEEYKQTDLVDMVSNIKEDRTPEDLLYACMLEWGLELSLPHKVENIAGYNVHIVNDGDLVACFDNRISEEAIKQIADKKPLRAVFRDSSFASDAARVNVGEIFKLKSPNTTIKVI